MQIAVLTPVRVFGDSLAAALNTRHDLSVATVVANFAHLQEAMTLVPINLVLIDVAHGIAMEEVRLIAAQWPQVILLAMGLHPAHKTIVDCGRAGFSGYTEQDAGLDQFFNTIDDAISGRLRCPPEVAAELLRALYREPASPAIAPTDQALTARECEVLRELGHGLSNKEIARVLNLSISTVKHHVHKVLEKLHVTRRADAMRKVRSMPWLVGTQREHHAVRENASQAVF